MAHAEPIVSEKRRDRAPMSNREEVESFLSAFARAFTTGDTAVITGMWETPAFVLGDAGAHVVGSNEEVARFFSGINEQYNARGIVETRPEILRLEWLTERIAVVEVRWPYLDAKDNELGAETSTYTLRRDATGALRLRVAVMHGVETAS